MAHAKAAADELARNSEGLGDLELQRVWIADRPSKLQLTNQQSRFTPADRRWSFQAGNQLTMAHMRAAAYPSPRNLEGLGKFELSGVLIADRLPKMQLAVPPSPFS